MSLLDKLLGNVARGVIIAALANASYAVAAEHKNVNLLGTFQIQPQTLKGALREFARQADVQLIFSDSEVRDKTSQGIQGALDAESAISQLLKGSGLVAIKTSAGTIIIRKAYERTGTLGDQRPGGKLASLSSAVDSDLSLAAAAEYTAPPSGAAQPESAGVRRAAPLTPGDPALEEVIVTARRTAERLQDVPVAVTAFSGAGIESRSVATLDEIAKYTPNIRFDGAAALSGGNYNATVFIRGVGQNDFAIFSDPGAGTYVDDVYYARSIGGVMDAIDIDSVQILRGPQGTLFGKNTIAGAVLISTKQPVMDSTEGQIEGTFGRFTRVDVKGSLNMPLAEGKSALRISAATINRTGYVKRLFDGGTQGDRSAQIARAKVRFEPNDAFTIDIGGDYTRAREASAPSDLLAVGNAPGIAGVPFLANYNAFVAPTLNIVAPDGRRSLNPSYITASPFTTWAGGPNKNDLDLWGLQAIVSYDFGEARLKSVSAYRDMQSYFTRDGDNTPYVFRQTTNRDDQWQFSEELQLTGKAMADRLSYVAGGFFFQEKASDIATADLAVGLWPPAVTTPPPSPAVFIQNYTNNRSLAAYGQLEFRLVPALAITLGGRYTTDRKRYTSINVRQRDLVKFVDVTKETTFNKFTPHVSMDFKPTDDLLLYASYSRGFKQGGFNGRPLASDAEVTQYVPETLDSYEVGVKAQWLNGQLTTNIAAFTSTYENIQLTVNQTPQNFVANAAKGKIKGLEFEGVVRPAPWMTLNAAVGYLYSRYTAVGQGLGPTQILPISLTSKFVKAPRWTANIGGELHRDFADGGVVSLRVDYSYYSRIYHDVGNSPIITDDGYGLLNARLSYSLAKKPWTLSVFATNLTNALYIVSGNVSGAFGLAEASYGRPREWGISASLKF